MKINLKDFCITGIYICVILIALIYMRFTLDEASSLARLRILCFYILYAFVFLYIILIIKRQYLKILFLPSLLFFIALHQFVSSYLNNLLIFPSFLIDGLTWIVLVLVFYDYSSINEIPRCFKNITIFGLSAICLASIPNIIKHVTYIDGNAVFSTYFCITFLPMVFYTCSKKTSFIFNIIVLFLMLLTIKRSAFIISLLGVLLYYITNLFIEESSETKTKKILSLLFGSVILVFAIDFIINRLNLSILNRLANMWDDSGSGRVDIWKFVLEQYNNSTNLNKLMGHGFHAVSYRLLPMGRSIFAHNSWIEMLYDYGVIGVSFTAFFVLYILNHTRKAIKQKGNMAPIIAFTCVPSIVLSAVSYFFDEATVILPICIFWGIFLGIQARCSKTE